MFQGRIRHPVQFGGWGNSVLNHVTFKSSSGAISLPDCPGVATLTVNPTPFVSIDSFACSAGSNATITLTATARLGSVNGPLCTTCTFHWVRPDGSSPTDTVANANGTSTIGVTVLGSNGYSVTVTDPHTAPAPNCTANATRKVGLCTD